MPPAYLLRRGWVYTLLLTQVNGRNFPDFFQGFDRDHRIVLVDPSMNVSPVSDRAGGRPATPVGKLRCIRLVLFGTLENLHLFNFHACAALVLQLHAAAHLKVNVAEQIPGDSQCQLVVHKALVAVIEGTVHIVQQSVQDLLGLRRLQCWSPGQGAIRLRSFSRKSL